MVLVWPVVGLAVRVTSSDSAARVLARTCRTLLIWIPLLNLAVLIALPRIIRYILLPDETCGLHPVGATELLMGFECQAGFRGDRNAGFRTACKRHASFC